MGPRGAIVIKYPSLRELCPQGQAAAEWFKQLARALSTCRLYRLGSTTSMLVRRHIFQKLARNLEEHGSWTFRITPAEIFLAGEAVVHPTIAKPGEEVIPGKEEQLPFYFYRDGIRGLTFFPGIPEVEFDAFFDALFLTGRGSLSQDDIVTLLWQANPTCIRLDSVPLEQVIYLSMGEHAGHAADAHGPAAGDQGGREDGSVEAAGKDSEGFEFLPAPGTLATPGAFAASAVSGNWSDAEVSLDDGVPGTRFASPAHGGDLRGDLGQSAGEIGGLHRDIYEDWSPVINAPHGPIQFDQVLPEMDMALKWFAASYEEEHESDWTAQVPGLVREMLALDGTLETRRILAKALAGWMAQTVQDLSWDAWEAVLQLMKEVDSDGSLSGEVLTKSIASLDLPAMALRLDLCSRAELERFLVLASGTGTPSLQMSCAVMSRKRRVRTRAMGAALLCALCDGRESLLGPLLSTQPDEIVEQLLYVIELPGGAESRSLLEPLLAHSNPSIRRGAVMAMGGIAGQASTALLLGRLDETNPDVLAGVLKVLARERNAEVARAILAKLTAPSFERQPEANRRAMLRALGEVADDENILAIRALLFDRKGAFKHKPECILAARTLVRISSPKARAVLDEGTRAKSKLVRDACVLALSTGGEA